MSEKLKKELTNLWTGELASIFSLTMCYVIIIKANIIQVLYPFLVLCFILLQGSFYWIICLKTMTQYKKYGDSVGKLYSILKYIDILLFLLYIPILFMSMKISMIYYVVGIFLILFGLVEFVNYFLFRLSYKNTSILLSQIKTKKLKKSRIAREMTNK